MLLLLPNTGSYIVSIFSNMRMKGSIEMLLFIVSISSALSHLLVEALTLFLVSVDYTSGTVLVPRAIAMEKDKDP